MAKGLSAATMAANWAKAMKSSDTKQAYIDGINSYNGNPMALAASSEAQALYRDNTARVVDNGTMAQALLAVPVSVWKGNAVGVGANALSTGATKAMSKMQNMFTKFVPVYAAMRAAAEGAAPKDGTPGSAIARVSAALAVLMAAGKKA